MCSSLLALTSRSTSVTACNRTRPQAALHFFLGTFRATAFDNEPISRFQIDFKTASHERKRFNVSTLMLFNRPGKEVFVHLCHPDMDATKSTVAGYETSQSSINTQPRILTPGETEVLTLLHKGKSTPSIAVAMGISIPTVRNHTQHVLLKLHAHTGLEAVARGRELGFV